MSNAAATVPAKRPHFRTKATKIPTLYDKTSKPKSKTTKKATTHEADILVVKHTPIQHSAEHVKSGMDQEEDVDTWMKRTKHILQSGIDKLEPSPKAGLKNKAKMNVKMGQEEPDGTKKPTIKILHVQHYDQLMEERKLLEEMNLKYEKRIEELEIETARVMAEFGKLYEDNEKLRRKMDTGKDPLLEPYSRVFEDRRILREAESGYKKRIERLEQEIREKQDICDNYRDEIKVLREKVKPTSKAEEKARQMKEAKLNIEIKRLKAENESLRSSLLISGNIRDNVGSTSTTPRSIVSRKSSLPTTITPEGRKSQSEKSNQTKRDQDFGKRLKSEIKQTKPKAIKRSSSENNALNSDKVNRVSFEEVPQIFDYMLLLPDSQVYD